MTDHKFEIAAPAGEPFASGSEADVYALPDGRVLRRYRDGDDATHEDVGMLGVAAARVRVGR